MPSGTYYIIIILIGNTFNLTGKVPDKLPEVGRLALINLAPTEPMDPPPSQVGSTLSVTHESTPNEDKENGKGENTKGKDLSNGRHVSCVCVCMVYKKNTVGCTLILTILTGLQDLIASQTGHS